MKTPILIIMSSIVLLSGSCKVAPDLTEKEVYSILNEVIADDSLRIYRVCHNFRSIPLKDAYRKEFSWRDIVFMYRQNELYKHQVIKPGKLRWYKRQDNSPTFTLVDTVCSKGILYHLSFPLVSADRQKLIVEFQEDCNCMLGGQGGKDLYEKKNGHWVRTKGFEHWISGNTNQPGNSALASSLVPRP